MSAILKNDEFEEASQASLEGSPDRPNFQYERSEWVLFRSAETLPQKAGVPKAKLRRLVLKELADNALDAGASVRVGRLDEAGDSYFVQDDGAGIDPGSIARLFSINRPLVSSKLMVVPSRGAMGNGLRVVTGSVIASDGWLIVHTRGQRFKILPQDDGSTVVQASPSDITTGTRIEIGFGPALPRDDLAMSWASFAAQIGKGTSYKGGSSPYWYDGDFFFELLQAAGERPVRDLVAELDGCSGGKAGKITVPFKRRSCGSMSRTEAVELLSLARLHARPVKPQRLPVAGKNARIAGAYDCQYGTLRYGGRAPLMEMPSAVEAWALPVQEREWDITILVNRTPITAYVGIEVEKGKADLWGCGLHHNFALPGGGLNITVNITVPRCPITTDGKEPDLSRFIQAIAQAIQRAAGRARRAMPKGANGERVTQKSVVLANLDAAIEKASGGGVYRFNQRQLFYVVRPAVMNALGAELNYGTFDAIVTDYESEFGDIPGMFRDPRGSLYHPHTGETIPLGTLAVEEYRRPAWTFGRILYIEKEGMFEALKAVRWPERHDCALVTTKGFTTRAVKDLLDLLGDTNEPLKVFCAHDADAAGTMIYQTLQEETRARPNRRNVEIINLGLEPWEALEMGLEVEGVEASKKKVAVAEYVSNRPDAARWRSWLRTHRVELNAMTTADFIEWLDAKMDEHDGEKVKPPAEILVEEWRERTEQHLRDRIVRKVLADAGIETRVGEALAGAPEPDGERFRVELEGWLSEHDDALWREFVDEEAEAVADQLGEGA